MPKYPEYPKDRYLPGDPDAGTSHVILGGRRTGKTTHLLKWLEDAQRRSYYPFWDRVLLVHTTDRAQHLRIGLRKDAELKGVADSSLYYNLVYSYEEWKGARLGGDVMIAVDDIDFLISRYFGQTPKMIGLHCVSYTIVPSGQVT
jgi:hypothetical protein